MERQGAINLTGNLISQNNGGFTEKAKVDKVETKDGATKNYNATSERIIIKDSKGAVSFDLKLDSPPKYEIHAGQDQLIAWVTLTDYKTDLDTLFEDIKLYDIKNNLTSITREITYKYGEDYIGQSCYNSPDIVTGDDVLVCDNITLTNWTSFNSVKELPKKNIRIGLFMDTFAGDNIEWVPTLKVSNTTSFEITEWAELVVPVNTTRNLNATDESNFIGTNDTRMVGYDSTNKLIFIGGEGGVFGFYNISDNTTKSLVATDESNFIGTNLMRGGLTHDPINNLMFFSAGGGIFGFYNISSNTTKTLGATDESNFIGTNNTFNMMYEPTNKIVYILATSWGFYNISDNTTKYLGSTDESNFLGTNQTRSITYDSANNLVYVGGVGGSFGFYNISDNTTKSLVATDESNFMGTNTTNGLAYDSTNNIVYVIGNSGTFGFYNISDNTTKYLGATDEGNFFGTVELQRLAYDSTKDIVYLSGSSGVFGFYNISDNTTKSLMTTDEGNFMGTQQIGGLEYDSTKSLIYVVGQLNQGGLFGVYGLDGYSTPPQWSNNYTNSTLAGTTINHSVNWTDNIDLNTSIFSLDDGNGSFLNFSTIGLTGTANQSNFTYVINSTVGSTINWRVYANDSSNTFNVTDTFQYTTTAAGGDTAPQWSSGTTNSTSAGATINHSVNWTDNSALSTFIFSFDNGNGSFLNNTAVSMTGVANQSNGTKVVNSTIGSTIRWRVYANDSAGQWNVTSNFQYTTTGDTAPQWSNNFTNSTSVGATINHSVDWTDDSALSTFIFSFDNGNGSFLNGTSVSMTGVSNQSVGTKNINSTVGSTIRWRFYANDSTGKWNVTSNFQYTATLFVESSRTSLKGTNNRFTLRGTNKLFSIKK